MQREIQMAVSGDQRGKAGEAAHHIRTCLSAELMVRSFRERSGLNTSSVTDPVFREILAANERLLPSCQAVDAASRAQLVPLLRRSLDEGDRGAAAWLVMAMDQGFKPAAEPAVMAALRREAWDCDRLSLNALRVLDIQHPQLLTPNEVGALRERQRAEMAAALAEVLRRPDISPGHKEALENHLASFKPPPGADPTEIARMAADIQSRCKPER